MFYQYTWQLALVLVPVYFIKHSVSCYIYYIHACVECYNYILGHTYTYIYAGASREALILIVYSVHLAGYIDLFFNTCLCKLMIILLKKWKGGDIKLLRLVAIRHWSIFLNAGTVIILLESCGSNPCENSYFSRSSSQCQWMVLLSWSMNWWTVLACYT